MNLERKMMKNKKIWTGATTVFRPKLLEAKKEVSILLNVPIYEGNKYDKKIKKHLAKAHKHLSLVKGRLDALAMHDMAITVAQPPEDSE